MPNAFSPELVVITTGTGILDAVTTFPAWLVLGEAIERLEFAGAVLPEAIPWLKVEAEGTGTTTFVSIPTVVTPDNFDDKGRETEPETEGAAPTG